MRGLSPAEQVLAGYVTFISLFEANAINPITNILSLSTLSSFILKKSLKVQLAMIIKTQIIYLHFN